jgi:hypothetical protein
MPRLEDVPGRPQARLRINDPALATGNGKGKRPGEFPANGPV